MEGGLEIPCVVNSKLIGTKKNTEISAKYLEIVKTRYTEPSFDENVIICSFLAISLIEYANTVNGKDWSKCPNKGKNNNSLKNVTMLAAQPSSDIRTF